MSAVKKCWCGNSRLNNFSQEYLRCPECETIVLAQFPERENCGVENDEHDFYGIEYFNSYAKQLGYPTLEERSRLDLPERCLHWLDTMLKYKIPPAKTLEIGSAHGGFVALMKWSGFETSGLELSPSVAKFSKEIFGIDVFVGPIEQQRIPYGSLDVIALMDVIEHFPDPISTMQHCLNLLKPDGIFLIQTPKYPEGKSFDELVKNNDDFIQHLKPEEHLYLFSERSIKIFFSRIGVKYLEFSLAIFANYDMFFVASPKPLQKNLDETIIKTLLLRPQSRLILALLDTKKNCSL